MRHVGDISQLKGYELEPVDVITGGSPCQDLSVAGKRAGMKQTCDQCGKEFDIKKDIDTCPDCGAKVTKTRSGLFIEQVRIIKEMRKADEARGRTDVAIRPRYMVWENVPGAFSSNGGEDFRAVLKETIRIVEPEAPDIHVPEGGWPTSGCFQGVDGRWSVAWRVLDAQFWGVPQRRRRIALVADFGGKSAPEILFVRDGMSWDSSESGTARKGAAGSFKNSVNPAVARSLTARNDGSPCIDRGPEIIMQAAGFGETGQVLAIAFHLLQDPISESEKTPCMSRGNPRNGQASIDVAIYDARGNGDGFIAPTLTGEHQNRITDYTAIALDKASYNAGANTNRDMGIDAETDTAFTITGRHPGAAMMVMAHGQANAEITEDLCSTINCNHEQPIVLGIGCRNLNEWSLNYSNTVRNQYRVRRLTPLECERLQGFPDKWTDVPGIKNPTAEEMAFWLDAFRRYDEIMRPLKHGEVKGRSEATIIRWMKNPTSDTARYKALGNSIALPPWKWILKRIAAFYERDATLGSLFDGIGGFPLIWEQINGRGTARWASEIEPFCIAVTQYRFCEED